jgi:hypothetical protein
MSPKKYLCLGLKPEKKTSQVALEDIIYATASPPLVSESWAVPLPTPTVVAAYLPGKDREEVSVLWRWLHGQWWGGGSITRGCAQSGWGLDPRR